MISIAISNATLILGAKTIFRYLNWEIHHNQRIGLVGPNGAGKSSLFKLIAGEYAPEPGGHITRSRGTTIGYLPQQPELDPAQTAFSCALAGNPQYAEIQTALVEVEAGLGEPSVYQNSKALEKALARQETLLEQYAALGGDSYPQQVRDMLLGLGLPASDLDKPLGLLSGGQKKLVGLARILLQHPSVLMLDEPDNHLDLAGKNYLERLIQEYAGAVVIISHDRYLLDAVVTHIVEIEDGKLNTFVGNYTDYAIEKEQRLARQEELFQIQQRAIQRMEMALKRYQLWVKVSDKFASRVRSMETRLEKVERLERPNVDRKRMGLELNGWRGSNKVLELREVSKSFDQRVIFQGASEILWHAERVGVMGSNGAGKSVLFRLILGQEQPDSGEILLGPSVKVGYYAQEHETLDFNQTVLDAIRQAGKMSEPSAVAFLLRHLFTYQQAQQRIGELSGGERSRLQLALLMLSGANFLLLDEPTNNLDIASAEVLENALADFNGTVLVISHDRYFLDRTVERILTIEKGRLVRHGGGYSDYLAEKGL